MNRVAVAQELVRLARWLVAIESPPSMALSGWREKAKKNMPLHNLLDRAWELNAEREVLKALNSGSASHIPKHLMDNLGPLFKKAISGGKP